MYFLGLIVLELTVTKIFEDSDVSTEESYNKKLCEY